MSNSIHPTTGLLAPTVIVNGVGNEKRHVKRHLQYDLKKNAVQKESRDPVHSLDNPLRDHTNNDNEERQSNMDTVPGNSMVDDTGSFYVYEDNESGDQGELDDKSSMNVARQILMKLTCQEPYKATSNKKKFKSYLSKDRPSLTNLHLELQRKFITDLQNTKEQNELKLQRLIEENKMLTETMSSLNQDFRKVTDELNKVPKRRLHLELVERVNSKLHDEISSRDLSLKEAAEEHEELRQEVHKARLNLKHCERDKEELVKELRRRGDCAKELNVTNCLVKTMKREIEDLKNSHKEAKKDMEKECEDKLLKLQVQLRAMKMKYGLPAYEDSEEVKPLDNSGLKALIQIKDESITALRNQVMVSESTRRKLHNVIQELRGNIRVFVRVRPFLENEVQTNRMREIVTPLTVLESGNAITINGKTDIQTYEFDKVYGPTCTQDFVFEELSDFVQSALDGYSACIFAYGQT